MRIEQNKDKNADTNTVINNGETVPLKTNVDASTNTAKQVTKTVSNAAVRQLDF